MFSHIMVGATDLEASKKFYDALLGTLGANPGYADGKGRVFWMTPTGNFAITTPINGESASGANGGTIGFACDSKEKVHAWHEAGLSAGGTAVEDAPGERAGSNLYLAYLRDPSGNKLCALHSLG
jgi:catechol 2,3-dioxygenase-like lactoylglutathione lyase family enzyme